MAENKSGVSHGGGFRHVRDGAQGMTFTADWLTKLRYTHEAEAEFLDSNKNAELKRQLLSDKSIPSPEQAAVAIRKAMKQV